MAQQEVDVARAQAAAEQRGALRAEEQARRMAESERDVARRAAEAAQARAQRAEVAQAQAAARQVEQVEQAQQAQREAQEAVAAAAAANAALLESTRQQVRQLQRDLLSHLTQLRLSDEALDQLIDAPRHAMPLRAMEFGEQEVTTASIEPFLLPGSPNPVAEINRLKVEGVAAMRREVDALGDPTVSLCLRYVLEQEAGTNAALFETGGHTMDCDAAGRLLATRRRADGRGMRLRDFVEHASSRAANLEEAHVAALRLYSTDAFRAINNPLRDRARRQSRRPHPLAVTVALIHDAAPRLRTVDARGAERDARVTLYRGLCDAEIPRAFLERGGTEYAPMSFTRDLNVAIEYSTAHGAGARCSTVLRARTEGAVDRGADIAYLSCFPAERETLYPPLTHLRPAGATEPITISSSGIEVRVIDVTFRN